MSVTMPVTCVVRISAFDSLEITAFCGPIMKHSSSTVAGTNSPSIAESHGDHVTVHDPAYSKAFKVHYAAIHTEPADAPTESGAAPADMELTRPSPPPEIASRADFRVGNWVTFTDKNLQHRVGLIVRVNQHTMLDCDGQKWRVAFELLRHLVDV